MNHPDLDYFLGFFMLPLCYIENYNNSSKTNACILHMYYRPGIANFGRKFYISSENTHTLPLRSDLEDSVQFVAES